MKRMARTRRRWAAAAAGLVAMVAGCGPDRPATVPVTGTVTFNSKPMDGVDVMFVSKEGRPARGRTDASGRFTLQTFEASDGARVGEHTVVFSKVVSSQPGAAGQEAANAHSPAAVATRETLPRACTSIMESPFKVTVAAGEENDFTFDLGNPGAGTAERSSGGR